MQQDKRHDSSYAKDGSGIAGYKDAEGVYDRALKVESVGWDIGYSVTKPPDLLSVRQLKARRAKPIGPVRHGSRGVLWGGQDPQKTIVSQARASWQDRAVADKGALTDFVRSDDEFPAMGAPAAEDRAIREKAAISCFQKLRQRAEDARHFREFSDLCAQEPHPGG